MPKPVLVLAGEDWAEHKLPDLAFKVSKLAGRVARQHRKQAFELIGICRTIQKHCTDSRLHETLLEWVSHSSQLAPITDVWDNRAVGLVDEAVKQCANYERTLNDEFEERARQEAAARPTRRLSSQRLVRGRVAFSYCP